jgi:hypothetical protein
LSFPWHENKDWKDILGYVRDVMAERLGLDDIDEAVSNTPPTNKKRLLIR